jgi:YHS domain-containing protein
MFINKTIQLTFIGLMSFILLLSSGQVLAADPPIYTGFFSEKAVSGYDTVAYFTDNKAVKGKKKYTYKYMEAVWYFKNQKNLDIFKASPNKYAPQYGGYCAWSVSEGNNASGDPKQWTIVNDKLYLNYDQEIQDRWLGNRDAFIIKADKNWPAVLK